MAKLTLSQKQTLECILSTACVIKVRLETSLEDKVNIAYELNQEIINQLITFIDNN